MTDVNITKIKLTDDNGTPLTGILHNNEYIEEQKA